VTLHLHLVSETSTEATTPSPSATRGNDLEWAADVEHDCRETMGELPDLSDGWFRLGVS
jgi:hypothetical protein